MSFLPSTSRCRSKPYPTLKGSTGASDSCAGAAAEGAGGDTVALAVDTSLAGQSNKHVKTQVTWKEGTTGTSQCSALLNNSGLAGTLSITAGTATYDFAEHTCCCFCPSFDQKVKPASVAVC